MCGGDLVGSIRSSYYAVIHPFFKRRRYPGIGWPLSFLGENSFISTIENPNLSAVDMMYALECENRPEGFSFQGVDAFVSILTKRKDSGQIRIF